VHHQANKFDANAVTACEDNASKAGTHARKCHLWRRRKDGQKSGTFQDGRVHV